MAWTDFLVQLSPGIQTGNPKVSKIHAWTCYFLQPQTDLAQDNSEIFWMYKHIYTQDHTHTHNTQHTFICEWHVNLIAMQTWIIDVLENQRRHPNFGLRTAEKLSHRVAMWRVRPGWCGGLSAMNVKFVRSWARNAVGRDKTCWAWVCNGPKGSKRNN